MKRSKTQNIIALFLLLIMLFFFGITFITYRLNERKNDIFIQSNLKQLEKSVNIAITLESKRLHQVSFNYTFWNDFVNYFEKRDSIWCKENIEPILSTYNIDASWIYDLSGTKTYSVSKGRNYDFNNYEFDESIIDSLKRSKFIRFYTQISGEIFQIFGATVHPGGDPERIGQHYGYFFIGRIIGKEFIANLADITGTNMILASDSLLNSSSHHQKSNFVSIPLNTLKGKPLKYLRVEKQLDFLKLYNKFSLEFIGLIYFSIIVIFISIVFFTSKWIIKPLKIVENVLESESPERAESLRKYGREFVKIGQLMTSYISQKKSLEILKKKAEESDRLKSAFMANMSHEIRTPLNGILGFTELMCNSAPADDTLNNYKKIIKSCSSDLLKLINDILDFSKIESGQLKIEKEIFTIESAIKELEGNYGIRKGLLSQKGIELNFQSHEYTVELNSDKRRLKQILLHLIDNAIKFTEKGRIDIGYTINDNKIRIYVKDTGIGVSKELQEVIFQRFWQAAQPDSKVYGGTGLGLALCKGLITLMEGDIWVESEIGQGSIFYIELPSSSIIIVAEKIGGHEKI
ncbi:MAG: ATP-binding protein [Tenuifilaceae bacterium]